MRERILILVGPTASGKSSLAIELAKRYDGEVISADSRQVYRGLDIGTGKVTKKDMGGVPHHLLDIASPKRIVTADEFARAARKAISDILARGKLPIIVGGTGFYIDALVGRVSLANVPPNAALRARLSKKTPAQLYALLRKKDPRRARAMDTSSERNNRVRLIRALEIAYADTPEVPETKPAYDAFWIGIDPGDARLKRAITVRLEERISRGMVAEARRLHRSGLSYRRMHELGLEYRALARLLQKEINAAEFKAELERDIWRYARKQRGYWNRNRAIRWFDPKTKASIAKHVRIWMRSN